MFHVKRIVVGVEMPPAQPWSSTNLKPPTQLAVQQAFEVASNGRATILLAAVLPKPGAGWFQSPEITDQQMTQNRAAAEIVLNELKARFASDEKSSKQTECAVRTGDAWEELIRLAGNRPDTLIVCGSRDLGSLRRVLFGSTGLKLLRLAPGPVWIVKPPLEDNESVDIVAATDLGGHALTAG